MAYASNKTQTNLTSSKDDITPTSKIPGGEKKELPIEPTPIEGCGPMAKPQTTDDDDHKTIEKQTKITDHFQNKRYGDPDSRTYKARTSDDDNKRRGESENGEYLTDDEEEKNANKRRSGPVTRSTAGLSRCSLTFSDSEDETNFSFQTWSQRDIAEYRSNYPNMPQNSSIKENYKFYTNKIPSYPDGDYIDNIHKKWFGDYRKLEYHHGYIQWLFPLQERGLNWSAEPLQKHEIELIKQDPKALERILTSYKMMLDFYGFKLIDEKKGTIVRQDDDTWIDRFRNLNTSSHNYLRITRILKCLGEFNYEHLKFPFLERILKESITYNKLPNCLRSCRDYWIETLRDRDERRAIRRYARELIEYRNRGIQPPKTHQADRPQTQVLPEAKKPNRRKLSE